MSIVSMMSGQARGGIERAAAGLRALAAKVLQ
jgi:hypothetical protein